MLGDEQKLNGGVEKGCRRTAESPFCFGVLRNAVSQDMSRAEQAIKLTGKV